MKSADERRHRPDASAQQAARQIHDKGDILLFKWNHPARSARLRAVVAAALAAFTLLQDIGVSRAEGAPAVALSASVASSSFGETVTFTATASGAGAEEAQPTGSITFLDGDSPLGTVPLSKPEPAVATASGSVRPPEGSGRNCVAGPNSHSFATCPVLQWGGYTYWAFSYFDNSNAFAIAAYDASGNLLRTWNKPGARYLWQITIDKENRTATFWGQDSYSVTMGWDELVQPPAAASLTTAELAIGTHDITAVYSGDSLYGETRSAPLSFAVAKIRTSTAAASSNNPSLQGDETQLLAMVSASDGSAPTGEVDFMKGDELLGTAPVVDGAAALDVSDLAAGWHPILASYKGDELHAPSTSFPLLQIVELRGTETVLTAGSGSVLRGESVKLTAEVGSPDGGTAAGFVAFRSGEDELGRIPLSEGQAALDVSELPPGLHTFTASYEGNDAYSASESDAVSVEVIASRPDALPEPPTVGEVAAGSALLSWKAAPYAISYVVYADDRPLLTAEGTEVRLDGLESARTYDRLAVAPVNEVGEGARAAVPAFETLPRGDFAVEAVSASDSEILVRWTLASANEWFVLASGGKELYRGKGRELRLSGLPADTSVKVELWTENGAGVRSEAKAVAARTLASSGEPGPSPSATPTPSPAAPAPAAPAPAAPSPSPAATPGPSAAPASPTPSQPGETPGPTPGAKPSFADTAHLANRVEIEYLVQKGLIRGTGGDRFEPNRPIARSEFVALLVRLLGYGAGGGSRNAFADVDGGKWYAEEIGAALEHGLISGDGKGLFKPQEAITREQAAKIAAAALGRSGSSPGQAAPAFADEGSVSAWARQDVRLLAELQLLKGYEDGSFRPRGSLTRAEAASLLYRLQERLGGGETR